MVSGREASGRVVSGLEATGRVVSGLEASDQVVSGQDTVRRVDTEAAPAGIGAGRPTTSTTAARTPIKAPATWRVSKSPKHSSKSILSQMLVIRDTSRRKKNPWR